MISKARQMLISCQFIRQQCELYNVQCVIYLDRLMLLNERVRGFSAYRTHNIQFNASCTCDTQILRISRINLKIFNLLWLAGFLESSSSKIACRNRSTLSTDKIVYAILLYPCHSTASTDTRHKNAPRYASIFYA